mmetsp:Transcript_4117/g.10135  ORF Transcript_4117/g.10135 Transcript_4117/m.10135 type:complete len:209 (-) Transcript_4117:2501-3127(-)
MMMTMMTTKNLSTMTKTTKKNRTRMIHRKLTTTEDMPLLPLILLLRKLLGRRRVVGQKKAGKEKRWHQQTAAARPTREHRHRRRILPTPGRPQMIWTWRTTTNTTTHPSSLPTVNQLKRMKSLPRKRYNTTAHTTSTSATRTKTLPCTSLSYHGSWNMSVSSWKLGHQCTREVTEVLQSMPLSVLAPSPNMLLSLMNVSNCCSKKMPI